MLEEYVYIKMETGNFPDHYLMVTKFGLEMKTDNGVASRRANARGAKQVIEARELRRILPKGVPKYDIGRFETNL